ERTTRARSTSPATFTLSRTVAPVISAPPSRPPGTTRRNRMGALESTLTSAAIVKPNTHRHWLPAGKAARHARLPRAPQMKTGPAGKEAESPTRKPAGQHISHHQGEMFIASFHFGIPMAYTATSNAGLKRETENEMAQKVSVLLVDDIDGSDANEI